MENGNSRSDDQEFWVWRGKASAVSVGGGVAPTEKGESLGNM